MAKHHEVLKLSARVGAGAREVEVVELAPHTYRVTIDGIEHVVDARTIGGGSLSLLIDQHTVTCAVRSDGDKYRVDLAGRTTEVRLIDTLRHGGVALETDVLEGPQEIRAMMPGKIVTLLVAVGDAVEKGTGVLVVEAMKMENEVKAAGVGIVKELLVRPGQAVEAGEILARLE